MQLQKSLMNICMEFTWNVTKSMCIFLLPLKKCKWWMRAIFLWTSFFYGYPAVKALSAFLYSYCIRSSNCQVSLRFLRLILMWLSHIECLPLGSHLFCHPRMLSKNNNINACKSGEGQIKLGQSSWQQKKRCHRFIMRAKMKTLLHENLNVTDHPTINSGLVLLGLMTFLITQSLVITRKKVITIL